MAFVRGSPSGGRVDLVSKDEAMPMLDVVYDAAIGPGGVERDARWRDFAFATVGEDKDKPWIYAVHRTEEGEPDAYAVYTMKHDWTRSHPSRERSRLGMRRIDPVRVRGDLAVPVRCGPGRQGRGLGPADRRRAALPAFGSRAGSTSA